MVRNQSKFKFLLISSPSGIYVTTQDTCCKVCVKDIDVCEQSIKTRPAGTFQIKSLPSFMSATEENNDKKKKTESGQSQISKVAV